MKKISTTTTIVAQEVPIKLLLAITKPNMNRYKNNKNHNNNINNSNYYKKQPQNNWVVIS